jgi:hypothetical protein
MTWIAAMKGAASITKQTASPKNETTSASTLLTGCRCTVITAAKRIVSAAAASNTSRCVVMARSARGPRKRP